MLIIYFFLKHFVQKDKEKEKNNNENGRNTQGDICNKFLMSQFMKTCPNSDDLCAILI